MFGFAALKLASGSLSPLTGFNRDSNTHQIIPTSSVGGSVFATRNSRNSVRLDNQPTKDSRAHTASSAPAPEVKSVKTIATGTDSEDKMDTCQTCYSDLPPSAYRSAYITPCCSSPICAECVLRNPRLKEYTPCLKCGDPRTSELRGGSSAARGRAGRDSGAGGTSGIDGVAGGRDVVGGSGEVMFEIGEEDDDDGDGDEFRRPINGNESSNDRGQDAPPTYDQVYPIDTEASAGESPSRVHNRSDEQGRNDSDNRPDTADDHGTRENPDPANSLDVGSGPDVGGAEVVDENALETVEVRHTVSRGDNLLSIARRYAADPHELLGLNNLPPTALSSHPTILHTRRTLLISKRQVPKSLFSSNPRGASVGAEKLPLDDMSEADLEKEREKERERERQKQIKRFQLITKNQDLVVASTYLSLEQMKEDDPFAHMGSGEALEEHFSSELSARTQLRGGNLDLAGREGGERKTGTNGDLSSRSSGKKTHLPSEGNREQRALDSFWEDEAWESQPHNSLKGAKERNGRWKVVNGGVGGIGGSAGAGAGAGSGRGSAGSGSGAKSGSGSGSGFAFGFGVKS